jgi:hypothetical protein
MGSAAQTGYPVMTPAKPEYFHFADASHRMLTPSFMQTQGVHRGRYKEKSVSRV